MPLKSNWTRLAELVGDTRTLDQITEHYDLEVVLAEQLRAAPTAERTRVYGEVYSTLFARIPHHPQNMRRSVPDSHAARQCQLIRRLVRSQTSFAEIGAGDAGVSRLLAPDFNSVVAIDVTDSLVKRDAPPPNFEFRLTDGVHVPLADQSVDFVYSNQLMEHLHPDDALAQLQEISRVLRPGGCYFCITPNAIFGPHDISRYFDDISKGFHLKEYTYRELATLFRSAGFSELKAVIGGNAFSATVPLPLALAAEAALARLPRRLQASAARRVYSAVLGVRILAFNPR